MGGLTKMSYDFDCSIIKDLLIEPGTASNWHELSGYHYCDEKVCAYKALYVLRDKRVGRASKAYDGVAGVIIYSMPVASIAARNIATKGYFTGIGNRSMQLGLINKNIRCIRRVIIEPRYRGIGLAAKLVRETMPLMDVPIIESLAVMGNFNPFFEKAGMTPCRKGRDTKSAIVIETLSSVGINEDMFIDPGKAHETIDALDSAKRYFVCDQFDKFIGAFGKRSKMPHSPQRTRYVLSKLSFEPVYYIWFKE
jgi:hypothetical protein